MPLAGWCGVLGRTAAETMKATLIRARMSGVKKTMPTMLRKICREQDLGVPQRNSLRIYLAFVYAQTMFFNAAFG